MIHEGAISELAHLRFRKELDGGYASAQGIGTLHFRHFLAPSLPAVDWGLPADLAAAKVGQLDFGDFALFSLALIPKGTAYGSLFRLEVTL